MELKVLRVVLAFKKIQSHLFYTFVFKSFCVFCAIVFFLPQSHREHKEKSKISVHFVPLWFIFFTTASQRTTKFYIIVKFLKINNYVRK